MKLGTLGEVWNFQVMKLAYYEVMKLEIGTVGEVLNQSGKL